MPGRVALFVPLRFKLRSRIANHTRLFYATYGARPRNRAGAVRPDTELVIEGFPRSGNTFAVLALQAAQSREIRIAHHLHAQAQVKRAVALGIPACVLVRQPVDTAKSLHVMLPGLPFKLVLELYRRFYADLYDLRDSFVVAPFEEVTTNLGDTIARINARFGTTFLPFTHSQEQMVAVNALIDFTASHLPFGTRMTSVARPTPWKDSRKATVFTTSHEELVSEVEALYRLYMVAAQEFVPEKAGAEDGSD